MKPLDAGVKCYTFATLIAKEVNNKLLYVLYQPYKWLILIPFITINTIFFGIVAVLVSSLVNQRVGSYFGGVIWSRLNALVTPMFVKVKGKEHVKKNISYVIVANHQSYYDIFLIYGWLGIDIKWVMKKELARIPGLGFGSKKVGHIFLDRTNSRAALETLNAAKRKLVNGTSVVIFPEGTRSTTGEIGQFKKGAFKLAIDLGLPILPVTITGTKDILPANSLDIKPGKAMLHIHESIDISGYDENAIRELMDRTRIAIEAV